MTQIVAPNTTSAGFNGLGLTDSILKSIEMQGYTVPTQIQSMAIPHLLAGRDLIGIAQTGGGKTAAFALPTINNLLSDYQKPRQNMPKVLILAPTRELAIQIEQSFVTYSRGTNLRCLVIAGGQPYPPQTNKLRRGVDILVATPGRLVDHIGRRNVTFSDTQTFILDEADRMLDMGFIDEVRDIASTLPEPHQTILFSATMNVKIRGLAKSLLTNPVNVGVEQKTAVADTISHRLMNVSRKDKTQLLSEILSGLNVEKALIFARTKMGADRLSKQLYELGIRSDAIHGDKRQRVREKILTNFRNGRTKVLVATDVAARGIDVEGISHVINYELPIEPENYIHRVGRTGRAGQRGIAISFCDPSDMRLLHPIERLIEQPIEVDSNHDFHIDVKKSRAGAKPGKGRFGKGRFEKTRNSRHKPEHAKSRPDRKMAPKKHGKPVKKAGKRYDPWPQKAMPEKAGSENGWTMEAKRHADDPVLGKLLGKPPRIDRSRAEKTEFVRTGAKKNKPQQRDENKPAAGKKRRGGKKSLGGKKNPDAKNPGAKKMSPGRKMTGKNNGGNRAFSPRRNSGRTGRAA